MRAHAAVAVAVAFTAVVALPRLATAQPGVTPPLPVRPPMDPASHPDAKSEGVALALSLGGTLASYAGFALGLALAEQIDDGAGDDQAGPQAILLISALGAWTAPSFGHWYAGKALTRGLGARAAGAGVALAGVMWSLSECGIFEECESSSAPAVLMIGGAALWIWGTVDDIATAGSRVRDYNRGLVSDVTVVPIIRDGGGSLALTGRF